MRKRLLLLGCWLALAAEFDAQNCVSDNPPEIAAPIRLITISNGSLLSPEKQAEIAKVCRERRVHPDALDREMNSLAEEFSDRVRAAYQDEGYFKVEVTARALKTTADEHVYDLEAQVRSVGAQYRLGEIRFVRAAAFSGAQLRAQFAVERGEIFSREKIAAGLEQLRRSYGSQGYINYTGVPVTEFDDEKDVVNLTLDIDEGKQFRVRDVQVLGVDAESKTRVLRELNLLPGDLYRTEDWERILLKFPDLAKNAGPRPVDKRLDEKNGLVDVVVDFRKAARP